jgi:hypothetical protein
VSFERVAEIVATHDPARALSAGFAPEALRGPLLAVYALEIELARATRVSTNPLVCELRLRWWRDQLEAGPQPRDPHPVLAMLAGVWTAPGVARACRQLGLGSALLLAQPDRPGWIGACGARVGRAVAGVLDASPADRAGLAAWHAAYALARVQPGGAAAQRAHDAARRHRVSPAARLAALGHCGVIARLNRMAKPPGPLRLRLQVLRAALQGPA